MSKKYGGTSSSIGTATHPVKLYACNKNKSSRKSRYKCIYYENATKECSVLRVLCVGPSNPFCENYIENKKEENLIKVTINAVVFEKCLGVGIVEAKSDFTFRVRFEKNNCVRSFFIKDIDKIENEIIYI